MAGRFNMTASPSTLAPLAVNDVRLSALLLDPARIDSVALRRLVDEVRNDSARSGGGNYDRVHNRHNR
jgi:hypothetical protein